MLIRKVAADVLGVAGAVFALGYFAGFCFRRGLEDVGNAAVRP